MLASRCDDLLSVDLLEAPASAAARRVRGLSHVRVERRTVPDEWPPGPFDLIVLSEIAYYFDEATLALLMDRALASAAPGATLVAVHWTGPTDYPLSGDAAHGIIGGTPGLDRVVTHVEDEFRLDVWRCPG